MDWNELFQMQKELDRHIEEKHGLKDRDLFEEKYLAMLVELGELANETRCFKFWSKKERSSQPVILEEYVDGIHFLLSLGLEKNFRFQGMKDNEGKEPITETEQFNKVFALCQKFKENPAPDTYEALFSSYLLLGELLGFQESDVREAYKKKNEVNYERQNKGY